MTATVTLRPLRADDVPAAVALSAGALPTTWTAAMFADELARPGRRWWVATAGEDVVGLAGSAVLVDELHVLTVAVAADHRRRGIGRRLVRELLAAGARDGARSATLEVRAGATAARALYGELGFVEEGRRPRYYGDEAAIIMWRRED